MQIWRPISLFFLFFTLTVQFVGALDLKSINKDLTRNAADKAFSKDYSFRVLSDASISRQWQENGTRTRLDFNAETGQLIMAELSFAQPISQAEGTQIAQTIGRTTANEWRNTTEKSVGHIGLAPGSVMKLANNSYLFLEKRGEKISKIVFFSEKPTKNRFDLPQAATGKTAMGSNGGSSFAPLLISDETRRQGGHVAAAGSHKKTARETATEKKSTASTKSNGTSATTRTRTRVAAFDRVLAGIGITEPSVMHYVALIAAIILITLLLFYGIMSSSSKAKPRRLAGIRAGVSSSNLSGNRPAGRPAARPTIRRR